MIQIGNNFGLLSPSTVFIGYANKRKIILLPLIVTHVKSLKIAPKLIILLFFQAFGSLCTVAVAK